MTPLEEIEQAITSAKDGYAPEYPEYLAALYQARAIERLEMTVRAIGVQLQGSHADMIERLAIAAETLAECTGDTSDRSFNTYENNK